MSRSNPFSDNPFASNTANTSPFAVRPQILAVKLSPLSTRVDLKLKSALFDVQDPAETSYSLQNVGTL
jgi:hypothetical protein